MCVGCGRKEMCQRVTLPFLLLDFLNWKGLFLTFAKIHTSVEKRLMTS